MDDGWKGARFALIVHHTDAGRQWAYDRKSWVGPLDKALDEAKAIGWTVVDMKTIGKPLSRRQSRLCERRGESVIVFSLKNKVGDDKSAKKFESPICGLYRFAGDRLRNHRHKITTLQTDRKF
jgi:hypothetical protein